MRYNTGTIKIGRKSYKLEGITLTDHGFKGDTEGTWAEDKNGVIYVYQVSMKLEEGKLPKIIQEIVATSEKWSYAE